MTEISIELQAMLQLGAQQDLRRCMRVFRARASKPRGCAAIRRGAAGY